MTEVSKTTDLHSRAQAVLERNAALGRDIRAKAQALLQHCQTPVDQDGYVRVRKGDIEALAAALDAEDAAFAHLTETAP